MPRWYFCWEWSSQHWLHHYSHTVCSKIFNRQNSFWNQDSSSSHRLGTSASNLIQKGHFPGGQLQTNWPFLFTLHCPSSGTHFLQNHPKPWLTLSLFFFNKKLYHAQNVNRGILTLKSVPTLTVLHWCLPSSSGLGITGAQQALSMRPFQLAGDCGFHVGSRITGPEMHLVGRFSRSTLPNTNPRSQVHTDTRSSSRQGQHSF